MTTLINLTPHKISIIAADGSYVIIDPTAIRENGQIVAVRNLQVFA